MTQDEMKQMQAMMGPMMERMKQKRQPRGQPGGKHQVRADREDRRRWRAPECEVWHGEYVRQGYGEKPKKARRASPRGSDSPSRN